MRCIAIVTLTLSLTVAASAQAQTGRTYGTFAPKKSPPPSSGSTFAPLPGSEPYRAHAPPPAPSAPRATDGGEAFKPFKPSSVYSHPSRDRARSARPRSSGY